MEDSMGDETKRTELERGNDDPLHATRKPSTADSVAEQPAQVAEMPTLDELKRRDERPEVVRRDEE
jgi:hypothetical protein